MARYTVVHSCGHQEEVNLIGPQASREWRLKRLEEGICTLQEFEPETYDRLIKRLKGVHTAALYANEATIFNTHTRPPAYKTWKEYRDFLLETVPTQPPGEICQALRGAA